MNDELTVCMQQLANVKLLENSLFQLQSCDRDSSQEHSEHEATSRHFCFPELYFGLRNYSNFEFQEPIDVCCH